MSRIAAVAVIVAIFLWFAWPGLGYYFTTDDVMNLRKTWPQPIWQVLRDCAQIWSQAYRPMGLLLYRVVFALYGWKPLPFHLVAFGLLLFNTWLTYQVARKLSGSALLAALTALIQCFHSRMEGLYFTFGSIYDIICYTFYFAILLLYLQWRPRFQWHQVAILTLLYVCAMDSKEMAVTLPVIILVLLFIYRDRSRPALLFTFLLVVLTAVFLFPKLGQAASLAGSYRPQYTIARFLETTSGYIGDLLYLHAPAPLWLLAVLIGSMLITALLLRSRIMILASIFLIVAPLPVNFVEPRGLSAYYIPYAGWALYIAALIVRLTRQRYTIATFTVAAVLLCLLQINDRQHRFFPGDGKSELVREYESRIASRYPAMPHNAKILIANDPFDANEWTPISLLQIHYGDPDLDIHRANMREFHDVIQSTKYDIVLGWP